MSHSIDAHRVLQEVVARYASFASYADEGSVSQRLRSHGAEHVIRFSTAYRKPFHFRFDFTRPHAHPPLAHIVTRFAVMTDGTAVHSVMQRHSEPPQVETAESLQLAIARATGISAGSAHHIARLLLPQVTGLSLLDLVDARLEPDTTIGSTPCYWLAALHPRSGELTRLCIEKDTLLIRRTQTHMGTSPSEETREGIRVNTPFDDVLFKPDAAGSSIQ
jgi:hypothetical protein